MANDEIVQVDHKPGDALWETARWMLCMREADLDSHIANKTFVIAGIHSVARGYLALVEPLRPDQPREETKA